MKFIVMVVAMDVDSLFKRIGLWSSITFPDARAVDHIKKLKAEADEVIQSPDSIGEYADCMIALFAAAFRAGFSLEGLIDACRRKADINDLRGWRKNPDGTFQHIKDGEPETP